MADSGAPRVPQPIRSLTACTPPSSAPPSPPITPIRSGRRPAAVSPPTTTETARRRGPRPESGRGPRLPWREPDARSSFQVSDCCPWRRSHHRHWWEPAALGCAAPLPEAGPGASSSRRASSSPKSGAWKGFVVGDARAAVALRGATSRAENSEVGSMGVSLSLQVPERAWRAVTGYTGPTAWSSWRTDSRSAFAPSRNPRVPRSRPRCRSRARGRTCRV